MKTERISNLSLTTITRFTKEQLIKRLEEQMSSARYALGFVQDSEILRDIEMDLRLAEIALASLEAEPVPGLFIKCTNISPRPGEVTITQATPMADGKYHDSCFQLYTAPPAPVVRQIMRELVPLLDEDQFARIENIALSAGVMPPQPVPEEMTMADAIMEIDAKDADRWTGRIGFQKGWNACRAAMLQGSQPVTNLDDLPEEKGASLQLRNLIRQRHAEWSDATFGDVGPVGPLKHLSKEALEAAAEPDDLSEWADMQFLLWDAQRRAGISDGEITAAMDAKLKVNMARQWPEPKDGEPRLHIKEQSESSLPEIECDICGFKSTDPDGAHYCCEDNSND